MPTDSEMSDSVLLALMKYSRNMYMSEHAGFILSPLSDILREGNSACRGIGDEMASFALSEYVMQTIFIKMTKCYVLSEQAVPDRFYLLFGSLSFFLNFLGYRFGSSNHWLCDLTCRFKCSS